MRPFNKAISSVRTVAETIIGELSNLSKHPQEVNIEFGMKIVRREYPINLSAIRELSHIPDESLTESERIKQWQFLKRMLKKRGS